MKALTRSMRLEIKGSLQPIAQSTTHYTGADLKAVLYSAQLRAAHRTLDREKEEKRELLKESSSSACEKEGQQTAGGAGVRMYKLSSGHCTELEPDPMLQEQVL